MAARKKLSKRLMKKITNLIEGGETSVTRICSLLGISRSSWYKWEASQNRQFRVCITRARARARENEKDIMVCEAKRALLMLLQGFYLLTTEEKIEYLEKGEVKTVTNTFVYVPASLKTIMFVLTRKDQANFSDSLRRHVNVKKGGIYKIAGQAGARILTQREAKDLGMEGPQASWYVEEPETLPNNVVPSQHLK